MRTLRKRLKASLDAADRAGNTVRSLATPLIWLKVVMVESSSPETPAPGAERIGVLLVNSGTPDSLDRADVRSFLRGLLSDPRVIEAPRAVWLPILHGLILRTRPRMISEKYRKIWTPQGSPLLAISRQLQTGVVRDMAARMLAPFSIEIAMLYSRPSVPEAMARLRDSGAQKILVLPLFPQYCACTTAATYDQVLREMRSWRYVPELRFVADYHDAPGYIAALRAAVTEHWAQHGQTQHLLVSFHGIPQRYVDAGDPYFVRAHKTARLLADELLLREGQWSVSFQSRFGPATWLQPYTCDVTASMASKGIESVTVVCPGFAIDCLETLEEIDVENRAFFTAGGGKNFQYVPALNARPDHVRLLGDLITRHCQGWIDPNLGGHATRISSLGVLSK
jgi:protoporphyrin/coproporphyrin ferrochelatase